MKAKILVIEDNAQNRYTVTFILEKVPMIAITSHVMPGDEVQALEAGCTGYIEKPINPDTFLAKIEKYLEDIENGAEV